MSLLERLRQALQAVRKYPKISDELEETRYKLWDAQQALDHSGQERERLDMTLREQAHRLNFAEHNASAALSALGTFCPKLSSVEEMKRFYSTISPSLDPSGFTLHRVAEKLTGIDVPSFFAYEDAHGLFEKMDGRQLLRYLTAARFHAVDWTIVPGTCHEAAELREVDTSMPEYQAFERDLYRAVLSRMGFEDLLAPEGPEKIQQKDEVIESKTTELKLYSPLQADLFIEEYDDPQILVGGELIPYQDAILQGIEDERPPDEEERGLMTYFDGSEAVDNKIVSVFPGVEELDGELYGVAVCQIKGNLSPGELKELKEFCVSQYADGWGESYEQRPRCTCDGALYVSFWQHDDFFLLTKEELERRKALARAQPHRGGEAR